MPEHSGRTGFVGKSVIQLSSSHVDVAVVVAIILDKSFPTCTNTLLVETCPWAFVQAISNIVEVAILPISSVPVIESGLFDWDKFNTSCDESVLAYTRTSLRRPTKLRVPFLEPIVASTREPIFSLSFSPL